MLKPPFWGDTPISSPPKMFGLAHQSDHISRILGGNMKTLGQASPAAVRCLKGSEGMEAQLAGGAGNGHQGGSVHSWDHSGGCTPTPVAYRTS